MAVHYGKAFFPELTVIAPTGTADAAPAILNITGMSGIFYKRYVRIQDSGGTAVLDVGGSSTQFYGGTVSASYDFWTATGANLNCYAGTGAQSVVRASRLNTSAAGAHAIEWGTRVTDVTGADTVNGFVTMEGDITTKTVTVTSTTPTAAGHLASKAYVDAAAEVAVSTAQPAATLDLWVDTDDYSSAAGSLSAWTPIPLASGFISYGSGLDPQYRIEPGGIVRLRGWIKPASGNFAAGFVSTIATLPVEARPGRSFVDFACVHGTITTTAGRSNTLRMEITGATGDMGPRVSTSPAYESYSWIGLDGITYTLEP